MMHAPMLETRTLTVQIGRPLATVYAYLAEPMNLPSWSPIPQADFVQVGENDYSARGLQGAVIIRFTPPNEFGVLDYQLTTADGDSHAVPVRLYANGEGCELAYTLFRRAESSDADFISDAEWLQTDLLTLKTMLEQS